MRQLALSVSLLLAGCALTSKAKPLELRFVNPGAQCLGTRADFTLGRVRPEHLARATQFRRPPANAGQDHVGATTLFGAFQRVLDQGLGLDAFTVQRVVDRRDRCANPRVHARVDTNVRGEQPEARDREGRNGHGCRRTPRHCGALRLTVTTEFGDPKSLSTFGMLGSVSRFVPSTMN